VACLTRNRFQRKAAALDYARQRVGYGRCDLQVLDEDCVRKVCGKGSELSIDPRIYFLVRECQRVSVARPLRVKYAGAIHYVLSRGDRRQPIVWNRTSC
jgi:hypothetical protein